MPFDRATLLALSLLVGLLLTFAWLVRRDCRKSGHRLTIYLAFRALWLFCKLWHGVRPRGPDPFPQSGPVILISNHTSPADPAFLQSATRRLISFLMAREYYEIRWLQPICRLNDTIPVNRTGHDAAALRATLRALKEGRIVGVFPEGGINLNPNSLGEAKLGTAMIALLSRSPIIPAFIDRKIHTNQLFEGVLYPAHARVYFGAPVDLSQYYDKHHDATVLQEVTDLLMKSIDRIRREQIHCRAD
jgi:1-acyl-sn-glycerol-3-phosphate acyltransferase